MGNQRRNYLKEGQEIKLSVNADGSMCEIFTIQKVIGEGGSSVCYEAKRTVNGKVKTGKLKEFYPYEAIEGNRNWYYSLKRLDNGQLIPCTGMIQKFDEMCQEYIESFKLLERLFLEDESSLILKNYIQGGEILYGCADVKKNFYECKEGDGVLYSEENHATVYIWSTGVEGERFQEYLDYVRQNPEKNADIRLHEILLVIQTLTDCVKAMHTAGILHLDIKPSNFIVPYKSDYTINAANISLFDINTISSIENGFLMPGGTNGFAAPEIRELSEEESVLGYVEIDNRADYYSIGAMLFYGLIILPKEIPDGLYKDCYYENIHQMLRHSKLIHASEARWDNKLLSKLADIMRKCLAESPSDRYRNCKNLLEDLKEVEEHARRYVLNAKLIGQNKKLELVDKNEKGINDPVIVLQKMLYDYPLYNVDKIEDRNIHVLSLGSGIFGTKFIDICLQAGQITDYYLRIKAVSNDPEDALKEYTKIRPAMSQFVNLNGSMNDNAEKAYASLDFAWLGEEAGLEDKKVSFSIYSKEANREIVKSFVDKAVKKGVFYQYIFVALGNDRLNKNIAALFSEELKKHNCSCTVCYISERKGNNVQKKTRKRLYPIYINEVITPENIDPNLERIAFNAHCMWGKPENMDLNEFLEEFRKDKYNYSSSLSFALSVKYKLYSIGIDMDDIGEAAIRFKREVLENREEEPEKQHKFDQLTALEHRRWVLEKLSDGWKPPLDKNGELILEECVLRGKAKDDLNLTHACLVFSTETSPLSKKEYLENNHQKWNDPDIDPNLDDLDRMSLKLHQLFRKYADDYKKSNPMSGRDMQELEELLSNKDEYVVRALRQFQFCLKNILNGVESYSRQYDYYEKGLLNQLEKVPLSIKGQIQDRMAIIKKAFIPVIEANLYRNYKANDEVLIEKLPYILTYHYRSSLALAFEDGKSRNGRSEVIFSNVASATVLSPRKLYYLYCFDRESDIDWLIEKIEIVLNYLNKRKIRCDVNFGITCMDEIDNKDRETLQYSLENLKKRSKEETAHAYLEDYEIMLCDNYDRASNELYEYLQRKKPELYEGGSLLFHSVSETGTLIERICGSGTAYFEFDWKKKKFRNCRNCSYLYYLEDYSYIRINDMFALTDAVDDELKVPEYEEDYEKLWEIYTGCYLPEKNFQNGVTNWNRLCVYLSNYEKKKKSLAKIPITNSVERMNRFTYFLPAYTFKTVTGILLKLIKYGVVDETTSLVSYTSDTCKLDLKINETLKTQFDELFANPQYLLEYYGCNVKKDENGKFLYITYNNLQVRDINFSSEAAGSGGQLYTVLKCLQEANFITGLRTDSNNAYLVSFDYSSPRIKKVLTTVGEILEIYAYYEALKTGYFDDVACGYKVKWKNGKVKNELDLILMKGFRSIIVECKAVQRLEQDFYHKLNIIAEHFGIGTEKVLIGNTYKKSVLDMDENNEIQKFRGRQLGITTFSEENEIKNLGEELKKLLK